jgi:PIN domain nuclease of toxin-antitoxin system
MLNLDTHILLHALHGTVTLREKAALSKDRWGISSIVLWEIATLYRLKRITLSLDHPLLLNALAQLEIWPISREVCLNIAALDFRSDPADELIASTSLTYGAPLMTRDKKIRASKVIRIL